MAPRNPIASSGVIFIGDVERFCESAEGLLKRIGLRDVPDIPHMHRNRPRRDALEAHHLAALEEMLAPHRAVYRAARAHAGAVITMSERGHQPSPPPHSASGIGSRPSPRTLRRAPGWSVA